MPREIVIAVPENYDAEDVNLVMNMLNSHGVNFKPLGVDHDGSHKIVSSRILNHPGHDNIVLRNG